MMERSDILAKTLSRSGVTLSKSRLIKVFNELKNRESKLELAKVFEIMLSRGICPLEDPRLASVREALIEVYEGRDLRNIAVTFDEFFGLIAEEVDFVVKVLEGALVVDDFGELVTAITLLEEASRFREDGPGELALATIDGQRILIGEKSRAQPLGDLAQAVVYALAIDTLGSDIVHDYVGLENSHTKKFEKNSPFTETGTLMVTALLYSIGLSEIDPVRRLEAVRETLIDFCGGVDISLDGNACAVAQEAAAGWRARLHLASGLGWLPKKCNDVENTVKLYGEITALTVTVQGLADFAATLAGGGVCPYTSRRPVGPQAVCALLSAVKCSGGWPVTAGGVRLIVTPSLAGIACRQTFSQHTKFSKALLSLYALKPFDRAMLRLGRIRPLDSSDPHLLPALFDSARTGERRSLAILILTGAGCLNAVDYMGRTIAHLSAAGGHLAYLETVLGLCPNLVSYPDFVGRLPIDYAKHFKRDTVVNYLHSMKL